ncbi:phosphoenolpyruvate--protein phosphotransferase [Spirochaetia bacterium 38H-sp]|uniref:Phosphoenolpyruvate-protein phosphotransferase n=1 Tax=Rarispira pelagica TaxID=3141764 RepID=A0ABU9UBB0_9SPIR
MKKFKGISVFPGIVIGEAFVYDSAPPPVPRYFVRDEHVDKEINRYKEAVVRAKREIESLKDSHGDEETMGILDSHLLMLDDPEFSTSIEASLRDEQKNVEWVILDVSERYIKKLIAMDNEYFRDRVHDLRDVSNRLINHLLYRERLSLADVSREVVLVCHDLMPSEAIQMNKRYIRGIAMDAGGRTSHTAILARAFEIPAVLGLASITENVSSGQTVILDGTAGEIIVDPTDDVLAEYGRKMREFEEYTVDLLSLNELPAETKDGKRIFLKANIEVPDEIDSVIAHGADGVGLFRTEFLFMFSGRLPDEDKQYAAYRRVLESMKNKNVIIRTLDLGGDKVLAGVIDNLDEHNPILGWRAIRFCLSNVDIFKTQLRALLRASVYGNLSIMFPLVSSQQELLDALSILDDVKAELDAKSIPYDKNLRVGVMIEVPAAALTADILAQKVDFFSIGTNDLIQYTLAIDRGNEKVAYLYQPFNMGVLRLIRMTVEHAHRVGIPVSMCGEMAGDPLATLLLLGLGLDELSMSPASIPEIKKLIRSVSLNECEELAGTVLSMTNTGDVLRFVEKKMKELGVYGSEK